MPRYYPEALRFVPAHTLAEKLLPGFVLRGGTLYAAVVRRDLGLPDNPAPLGTSLDLEALKWTAPRPDPVEEAARLTHRDTFDLLGKMGVGRPQIAAIALFRTHVPEAVTAGMLEVARALPPDRAPRVVRAEWMDRLDEPDGPGGITRCAASTAHPTSRATSTSPPSWRTAEARCASTSAVNH